MMSSQFGVDTRAVTKLQLSIRVKSSADEDRRYLMKTIRE